jgi:hypothetical protein
VTPRHRSANVTGAASDDFIFAERFADRCATGCALLSAAGREPRKGGAVRLHATLLGHALGHDRDVVKKLCYFRELRMELAEATSAGFT